MNQSFDPAWEKETYSQMKHFNRYPYGDLVSYVMRLYGRDLKAGKKLRVLEIGSGTGNNLAFLAREGFETYGIDGSATACAAARTLLSGQSLRAEITQGDFIHLPHPDGQFDLILDREALYCNRKAAILEIMAEIRRCLKPGGRFLSFAFSTEDGRITSDGGELVEENTYRNFRTGGLAGAGTAHFFTEREVVSEVFKGFQLEFMFHHRNDQLFPERRNQYAEFVSCGKKT